MPTALDPSLTPPPGAARAASGQAAAGEYLTFRLGPREYGIDIQRVQEIRGHEKPTRMVSTPTFINGVLNLPGVTVPIVDLRLKLDPIRVSHDGFTVTIVLQLGQQVMGVVVDSVADVLLLNSQAIKPASGLDGGGHSDHIAGIGMVQHGGAERTILLVNIARLMSGVDRGLIEPALH